MYIKANTNIKGVLGGYEYVARNSHRSDAFSIFVDDANFRVLRDVERPKDEHEFVILFDLGKYSIDDAISFSLDKLSGFEALNNKIIVECICVSDKTVITDAFAIGKENILQSVKYQITLDKNLNVLIYPNLDHSKKLFVRFRFISPSYKKSTWNNGFVVKNLKKQRKTTDRIFDYVEQGFDEVIFPEVRYVSGERSKPLLISFAPLNAKAYQYNTYDFFSNTGFNRLLVNDSQRQWYLRGFHGLGDDIDCIIESISNFSKKNNVEILTFGVSMGGYASFVYGNLLKAKRVLAINPESHLMQAYTLSGKNINPLNPYLANFSQFIKFHHKRTQNFLLFSSQSGVDYRSYKHVIDNNTEINALLVNREHNFGEYLSHDVLWILNYYEFGEITITRDVL